MDYDKPIESKQFKVIILGDGAVGKSSIATRFANDQFSQTYKQTIGVDFSIKKLQLPPNTTASLQLWDIGGQSIGSKMIEGYISGAHAVLLCYDITNYDSFVNLEDWLRIVLKACKDKEMPLLSLVGNKSDLRHLTAVKTEQHNAFAEENKMSSFIMSAKSGDQVTSAFLRLAAMLCGITLSQKDLEGVSNTSVVPAKIIDHERHDKLVQGGKVPDHNTAAKKKSKTGCVIS